MTIQRKHQKNAVTVTDILYLLTIAVISARVNKFRKHRNKEKKKIKSEHLLLGTRNMYIKEWL